LVMVLVVVVVLVTTTTVCVRGPAVRLHVVEVGAPDAAAMCRWDGRLSLPLTFASEGVYTVPVSVEVATGQFREVRCVLDTGSRHLSISAAALGIDDDPSGNLPASWTRRTGAPVLHYGTQTDTVEWVEAPVRIAGKRVCHELRDVTLAVARRRECQEVGCFNVMGMSMDDDTSLFRFGGGAAPPFLRQLAKAAGVRPSFSISMRDRRGGELHINMPLSQSPDTHTFLALHGTHWYLLPLVGVLTRRRGEEPVRIPHDFPHDFPDKLMIDTGSNMLGCADHVVRTLEAALGPGMALVLRLRKMDGTTFDYDLPRSTYAHVDGSYLFDPHEVRSDIMVLGAMMMIGSEISFDVDRGVIGIRRT
jgi:hypothetical protein